MEFSDYVTLVIMVPETHAPQLRDVLGEAGAGKIGDYSHCSFSVKGISRFLPKKGSDPTTGEVGVLEEVVEERIETVCHLSLVDRVVEAIKKEHPYEETVVDIYPLYEMSKKSDG